MNTVYHTQSLPLHKWKLPVKMGYFLQLQNVVSQAGNMLFTTQGLYTNVYLACQKMNELLASHIP